MARASKPKMDASKQRVHIGISNVERSVKEQLERIARKQGRPLANFLRIHLRELARNGTAQVN